MELRVIQGQKDRPLVMLVQKRSVLRLLAEHLLSRSLDLVTFERASSAKGFIQTAPRIDALITSLELEDHSGGCNVARIFASAYPDAPIIIFTAKSHMDFRIQLLRGIPRLRVVAKPFGVFSLERVVRDELGRDR